MSDIHPAAAEARRTSHRTLLVNAHRSAFDRDLIVRRVADPNDPLGDNHPQVTEAIAAHLETQRLVDGIELSEDAQRLAQDEWCSELRRLASQWERLRVVHADMQDNPQHYGGVMLDGKTPIVAEEQAEFVRAYDAAIAHAKETLTAAAAVAAG